MSGTSTRRRDLPVDRDLPWKLTRNGFPETRGFYTGPKQTQVTTSYRTGGPESGSVDEDNEILNAKNSSEKFRSLKKDSRGVDLNRPSDTGHPFSTEKRVIDFSGCPMVTLHRANGSSVYRGPLIPDNGNTSGLQSNITWHNVPSFDSGYYGPRAISATIPTNPASSLAVSLAELKREGLPSLPGYRSYINDQDKLRQLGDEYLNLEFGWRPLVKATVDTMVAVAESARILRQYQRDSGRWVRRAYRFRPEDSTTIYPTKVINLPRYGLVNVPNSSEWGNYFSSASVANFHESVETNRKIWFSGAYSYFLPTGDSISERLFSFESRANRLLGLRLTPEVLWELAPWSWLVDWGVNVQDNIHNVSAFSADGLVIRYGYLMCHTTVTHTYTSEGALTYDGRKLPATTLRFITESKQRIRANPYGFGSDPAGYTPRQWAILAALGLTKAPRSLR